MKLEKLKPYEIEYTKSSGEISTREIIPLTEVNENVMALDLTGLNELQKKYLLDKQTEYNEYVNQIRSTIFDFNTWYEQIHGDIFPEDIVNFKKFTIKNITKITSK